MIPLLRVFAVCAVLSSLGCGASTSMAAPSPTPTLLSISVAAVGFSQPGTLQLIATGHYSDTGRDLTNMVMWQSSDSSVAMVSTTGRLTIVGDGATMLTATYQGMSGTLTLRFPSED